MTVWKTIKRLFQKILRPDSRVLFLFSALIFPVLLIYVWKTSFSWVPPPIFHHFLLVALLVAFSLMLYVVDTRLRTSLSKYGVAACLIMFVLTILWIPISDLLQDQSIKRGMNLIERIEEYKKVKSSYPDEIDGDFFTTYRKKSLLGTEYEYNYYEQLERFSITFYSFGGYWTSFNSETREWIRYD